MSIDLYAPGRCIDIPFLCEHVYLRLAEPSRPAHEQLQITEVYDVLVRNPPGSEPLTGLYALFPHDCTIVDPQGRSTPSIMAPQVTLELTRQFGEYEWPFLSAPSNLPDGRVERIYPADPSLGTDALKEVATGTALPIEVGFPPELRECEGGIEALANRRKTLVHLDFLGNAQLEDGQQGWLRLIVTPRELDGPRARVRRMSGLPDKCSQWLTMYCPFVIRDQVRWLLRSEVPNASKTAESLRTRTEVERIVLARGVYSAGTSTRIEDHRIAIVAPPEIDVDNPIGTPSVHFYGVYQLEAGDNMALLWATGSSKNWESDLVYNARRVFDRLRSAGPDCEKELVRDLAPGRYAAMALLVDKMKHAGLVHEIGASADGLVTLAADDVAGEEQLLALRRLYASREAYTDGAALLMNAFSDLHPFSIHYKVTIRARSSAVVDEAFPADTLAKTLDDSVVANGRAGGERTFPAPSSAPERPQSEPAVAIPLDAVCQLLREVASAHSGGDVLYGGHKINTQEVKEQVVGEKYADQSSAPTGAKAIGPHARAKSRGDATQVLIAAHAKELSRAFQELMEHVTALEVGDPTPKRETAEALVEAANEASSHEPRTHVIRSAWEKAAWWFEMALAVGIFAADRAKEVSALVHKVKSVLG